MGYIDSIACTIQNVMVINLQVVFGLGFFVIVYVDYISSSWFSGFGMLIRQYSFVLEKKIYC